ncbi:hypothetical protein DESC_610138 [Desulfosarcina cetonica]|nr:hypothetical protein DESC_610138 [Desulfosarcina cetonica]
MCLLFSQITRTVPFRLMILHLLQIFLTDALTFMVYSFMPNNRMGRRAPFLIEGVSAAII